MADLKKEIDNFKLKNYASPYNNENYIYLRLSSLDNTIKDKDKQIKDAINKLQADFNKLCELYPNLQKEGYKLFVEVKSAYKNTEREEFINLYENYLFKGVTIKALLENDIITDQKNLYISSFDRLSRVFFYSLSFQLIRKKLGINIFTLMDNENNLEKQPIENNNEQLIYVFQLMLLSSQASKHSEDFSNKVKKRVDKNKEGKTISNKTGAKWGKPETIPLKVRQRIKTLYKVFTAQEISERKDIYKLINGKKESVSVHTIRKIVNRE